MYIDMCEHVFYLDILTIGNGVKGGVSFSVCLALCVIHTSACCIMANENSKPPKLRCMVTGYKSYLTVAFI